MRREPTAEEHEAIARAAVSGDRIQAISLYIAITECGLTEAQKFVRGLATNAEDLGPDDSDRSSRKRKFRLFGR